MSSPAPLNARSMLSAMESLNTPREAEFNTFLAGVIMDDAAHARFLNLLSLLEHMGSRKIMLSQMKGVLTQDILKHLAEETRHAFFFKRAAEKLSATRLEGYDNAYTMCAASGRGYFGRLDSGLTAHLPANHHAETGYLWVSLIVELRAIWVYRMYQECLNAARHSLSLKSILAEEENHLTAMALRLEAIGFDTATALPAACDLEKNLFEKLLRALQQDCGTATHLKAG